VHVDFQFEPLRINGIKNKVAVSLYEPDGAFRGTSIGGSAHKVFDLGADSADDGFFPGPLPPGQWIAELDTLMILPGPAIRYELGIWLSSEPVSEIRPRLRFPRPAVRRQPGWYRGDLHVHTYHSDGHRSVAELISTTQQHGLDFIALTEHNNVTQLYDSDLDGVDNLVIIPGMEVTTYYGHALSLGTTEWIDWRIGHGGRRMQDVADEIHAQGGILVAAHVANTGDPFCTGCTWLFDQFMPGDLDAAEVWNERWEKARNNNEVSLRIWYGWLNAGHRLPATAGTDAHSGHSYDAGPGFNLIWADDLSHEGLLDGLHRGHVMLSSGPRLWIEAPLPGSERVAMMGDIISAVDYLVPITVRWADAPADARVQMVVDGYVQVEWPAGAEGEQAVEVLGLRWIVAEMRSAQGSMLALTNPIYLDRSLSL